MGKRFTITESERNRIKGLYEQQTPPPVQGQQPAPQQTTVTPQIQSFAYGPSGINEFVVATLNGLTKDVIYNKTLNWIKETYKNPDKVIKMTMQNEKVRFDGMAPLLTISAPGLIKRTNVVMSMGYSVEVMVKDGKFKFTLLSLQSAPNGYPEGFDYRTIPNFKTDEKMLKNFGNSATVIEGYFNKLVKGLSDYIVGGGDGSKNDDW
jgi:hypothetical protein